MRAFWERSLIHHILAAFTDLLVYFELGYFIIDEKVSENRHFVKIRAKTCPFNKDFRRTKTTAAFWKVLFH